jgi:aspartyl-tRNA synthetase
MSMLSSGFTSIATPKITPGRSEGGSAVFELMYINGKPASLAQSPQLYKQMAINGGMNRVFEIGPVFRAEKSDTTRHLCEYTGLHAEMEIQNDYHEVIRTKVSF